MPSPDAAQPGARRPSVFLSYASEDRAAAQTLRDGLLAFGLEVLYDESSLVGGDAWDQKIRRQIRECDYFMPLISAHTAARAEGYFRREWRLAVERTLDMADDHVFLLPVVIDDTSEARARVPDKFLAVQWLRLPGGRPTATLEELCRRLLLGQGPSPLARAPDHLLASPAGRAPEYPSGLPARAAEHPPAGPSGRAPEPPFTSSSGSTPPGQYPPFPREEPGQRARFWLEVFGWTLRSAWISFKRVPRWVRICVYLWIAIALLSEWGGRHDESSTHISAADAQKLKAISEAYPGSASKSDVANLALQIAREFANDGEQAPSASSPVLAIPFSAPSADAAAAKLADATFAQVYGRIAITHHGRIGLTSEAPAALNATTAAEQGRAHQSNYVLYGTVDRASSSESLSVSIVTVSDGDVAWSRSYPVAGADPARIAAEVSAALAKLEED